jgi:uncharacterized membrane protein
MLNRSQNQIRLITVHSMFIAIIALMGFVPFLGFIPIGAGASLTIMHLPVILGATLLTWKSATWFGFAFGIVSLLVVLTNPAATPTDLIFVNPLISVLPRILFGLFAGLLGTVIHRFPKRFQYGYLIVLAFIATLFHTVLVLSMIWLFEGPNLVATFGNLWQFIWVIFGINGFFEALVAALIIPALTVSLNRLPFLQHIRYSNKEEA